MLINHYLHHQREFQIKFRHILLILAICFAAWQYHQYVAVFDSCQNTLDDVRLNLQILEQEIATLQASMSGIEIGATNAE